MKNKKSLHLLLVAILGTILTWVVIDKLIISMPIWKYLIIETIIVVMKMLYEKEKTRLEAKK